MLITAVEDHTRNLFSKVSIAFHKSEDTNEKVFDLNMTSSYNLRHPIFGITGEIILTRGAKKEYGRPFYRRDVDYCQILSKPDRYPIDMQQINHIRGYGELPSSCPIKETVIYVKNFRMSLGTFPAYMPKMEARLICTLFDRANSSIPPVLNIHLFISNVKVTPTLEANINRAINI